MLRDRCNAITRDIEHLHMSMRMTLTAFTPGLTFWQDKLELKSRAQQKSEVLGYVFYKIVEILKCVIVSLFSIG